MGRERAGKVPTVASAANGPLQIAACLGLGAALTRLLARVSGGMMKALLRMAQQRGPCTFMSAAFVGARGMEVPHYAQISGCMMNRTVRFPAEASLYACAVSLAGDGLPGSQVCESAGWVRRVWRRNSWPRKLQVTGIVEGSSEFRVEFPRRTTDIRGGLEAFEQDVRHGVGSFATQEIPYAMR